MIDSELQRRFLIRVAVYRAGVGFRQPRCCCARYAFSRYAESAARRGGKVTAKAGVFVPCGIFHRPDPASPPWIRDSRVPFSYWNEMNVPEVRAARYGRERS